MRSYRKLARTGARSLCMLGLVCLSGGPAGAGARESRAAASAQAEEVLSRQVGPCINIGDKLDARHEGDLAPPATDKDFTDIAAVGFKTVRLPVMWSAHQGGAPDYMIDPAFMQRVVDVVDAALAADLRVILDVHHFHEAMRDPAGSRTQFLATWTQISDQFAGAPPQLWFELLNEPQGKLTNRNIPALYAPAIDLIRQKHPDRVIVIGGGWWSSVGQLKTIPLFKDPDLVYTFHYYDPVAFSQQGAPTKKPVPIGATFGTPEDYAHLKASAEAARAFVRRTGKPLFLGEFGAYGVIPQEQRVTYYKAVHDAFENVGIDSCAWGYDNSYPIRDPKTRRWSKPMLRALGL